MDKSAGDTEPQTTMSIESTDESTDTSVEPQERSKSRPWLLLFGLLGFAGGGILLWQLLPQREATTATEAAPATAVTTATLQLDTIEISSEFVGFLEAERRVTLRPEVAGQIVRIFVDNGDFVAVGAPVMQLNPRRPKAVVSEAQASIKEARAARDAARAEMLEAEAEIGRANAEKNLQDTEFARNRSLVAEGALAQQALDVVTRDREAALAALEAAERRFQAAEATLSETDAALARAESSTAVVAEDLAEYEIVAPTTGAIGDLPVKVGDYVEIGDSLTTLTDNQTLDLRMAIPVERSNQLRSGLPVELRTDAGSEVLVGGTISFVAARVEEGAQSILVKATFPNPKGQLRDGQFVRATIVWSEERGVLVPTTAISRVGGQSFVFVMEPAAEGGSYQAEQRPIQVGKIVGNRYQVTQGLEAGETIITSGILRLADGAPVMPEASQSPAEESAN